MKKMIFFILLFFLLFPADRAAAFDAVIEYDEIYIEYGGLSYEYWKNEGNNCLKSAQIQTDKTKRLELYGRAAGAYQTITKIYPQNAVNMAILGHIYGKMNQQILAKSYLDRALNLDIKNPEVNYYYGIFHDDERNYRKSLFYYKTAYENGLSNDYELNCRIASIYAKLGELQSAKYHYTKALNLKPSSLLKYKIRLLDDLKNI